ncbi:hypothetical protein KAFR_0G00540 [Kazachstania africana CBS 2517]|uniref:Vacuolar protein sorting-associated protein 35 n=1 Tax=Kazachstania africana (strain ATCC 22294 / BCRC 22015 / CBS 2517 / CECT 1963 / NBRC 1671 / NRRL Y-8276) TaxID=1071382 RepID=H2AXI7_KAZAF|nr:hypothetical protein KAFR_0G00540 [Kazachstania africana CBS 2517]CCF59087.1 hypothetical protein KAFR_0G00540 [Kazachstania africana CBS 2517]
MSYSDSLDQAITTVKQQSILVQRSLAQRKLMDALRYSSIMLTELRNPKLLPKQYYELYIMIYDALTVLSNYLFENHPKKHHLADLYELVQYAGNVIPRLYLMITVGTTYLKCPDAPTNEILKDMLEMCRGVQNPIRGLFLRYYLSQRTKELLPENEVALNSQFIITNFIEMNKLWVRLQHQGPLREREQRTKERKELQILVGSQLVRLSQVIDDNLTMYKDQILPIILEQIVQCRDIVCQEYLFDIICQVFPDEFHLNTLDTLLETTLLLNTDISVNKLISTLVERLNGYLKRIEQQEITNQSKVDVFDVFWNYLNKLNEERPDLSISQMVSLIEIVLNLNLHWFPNNFENLNKVYELISTKCNDFDNNIPKETEFVFLNILTLQNFDFLDSNFYFKLVIECPAYSSLLSSQNSNLQTAAINKLLDVFITADNFVIDSKTQLESFLKLCEPLIKMKLKRALANESSPTNQSSNHPMDPFVVKNSTNVGQSGVSEEKQKISRENIDDLLSFDPNQEKLSKFIHILFNSVLKSTTFKKLESQVEILLIIKNWLYKGGKNITFTYPSVITNFWRLIRKASLFMNKIPKKKPYYENVIKQNFKYISRCTTEMFNICGAQSNDQVFKIILQTASLADQLEFGEIAYDFFSQAFTIFEECLTDSTTQFQELIYMAQILQRTRSLYKEDYYDSLIVRSTLHGSKLLKKQDQCRAVYLCSHLWWATEISSLGEEEGVTEDFFRDGKRVLECLQRSLRSADSIMDNVQSCELMVEILNRCLYYFIHGEEYETHVTVNYINGLIELIKTNLKSLKLGEEAQLSELRIDDNPRNVTKNTLVNGSDGNYVQIGDNNMNTTSTVLNPQSKLLRVSDLIQVPIQHFHRTCKYIVNQRDIDPRFETIVV